MTPKEIDLVKIVGEYRDDSDEYFSKIPFAIEFMKNAHKGQKRASGEGFFTHPLAVAHILASLYYMDSMTIIAALLHDVVEDTDVSIHDIEEHFGTKVASLVDGVTKLTKIESKSENIRQAANFRKLIVAISKDIRVLIIKLADRLHNMQTLPYLASDEKKRRIALETIEVYAPLAERVGMHSIKGQLQDLAFATLHTNHRNSILKRLELLKQGDNALLVRKITSTLKNMMKDHGIEVRIIGREKTPFSIWEKMKRKNISFEQLSDVMAFRIIVSSTDLCYRVLGVIHTNYHTIPGKFKDFISLPKKNGYQSIHTIILGPEKEKIEVQIRTEAMHNVAENGVAAHWHYKQKFEERDKRQYDWIQELLEISQSTNDFSELLEDAKLEMRDYQVFCFTPKGTVIGLPKGASVIDFAYAVHSDLGNTCIGAKINHQPAPLKTILENGDQVEILTSDISKPIISWKKYAVTAKALNEIRKFTRERKQQESLKLGSTMLEQVFAKHKKVFSYENMMPALDVFDKSTVEDLICAVGLGHLSAVEVFKKLFPNTRLSITNVFSLLKAKRRKKIRQCNNNTLIRGLTLGENFHFASCCSPIPGDRIVGINSGRKGVTIHVLNCETLQNYIDDPGLWVDLSWNKNINRSTFSGAINIVLQNAVGALADVILEISRNDVNIDNLKIINRASDFFEINIDLETKGLNQLMNIISVLQSKTLVHSVRRLNK